MQNEEPRWSYSFKILKKKNSQAFRKEICVDDFLLMVCLSIQVKG